MILLTVGIYSILAPDVIKAIRMEVVSVVLGYNNWWQISENADYFTRMANQSPFTHLWFWESNCSTTCCGLFFLVSI